MEKNEVYNYLAKIYFDKKDTKKKKPGRLKGPAFFLILIPVILLGVGIFSFGIRHSINLIRPKNYQLLLSSGNNLIKINYTFGDNSSLKKEGYTLALSDLNAENYQFIQFSARRLVNKGTLNLKVEIENRLKEKAFVYINTLSDKWNIINIDLNDFKGITYWNNIERISFIAEEWNAQNKHDVIYIEEIRFSKSG